MSLILRIMLIASCMMTCVYTLRKIRKSQMQIEDSLFWICMSFGLVFLSIFPGIATKLTELLGIISPVNFVFLVMIFILILKVFLLSLKVSQLEDKQKHLVQRIAIQNMNQRKEEVAEKKKQEEK